MKTDAFLFVIAVLAVLVVGAMLALSILYPNGAQGPQQARRISISASGIAYASPSMATMYVMINGSGYTPAMATANLSDTMNAFNSTVLKYIEGNVSGITTQSYSMRKVYNRTAYQATEFVTVSIPDIGNVSPLLGSISSINNVYVDQVEARLSGNQTSAMINDALSMAVQNATSQAREIAGNSTLTITNVSVYGTPRYFYYPLAAAAEAGTNGQLYFNGRQGVRETVSIEFLYR
ncbi:MAG: SIMPL domain-containing protein [Candidatus Marsarchaeota archaeon]|nr:SIMPL domain-containing protein [Candidatus Marsarchaeota archaeon]MCL5413271.1 SIMPL domain-containing protein [Candidatus Marsarchaeota archaeon]